MSSGNDGFSIEDEDAATEVGKSLTRLASALERGQEYLKASPVSSDSFANIPTVSDSAFKSLDASVTMLLESLANATNIIDNTGSKIMEAIGGTANLDEEEGGTFEDKNEDVDNAGNGES